LEAAKLGLENDKEIIEKNLQVLNMVAKDK